MADESSRWSRRAIALLKKHRSLNQNVFIPFLILMIDLMIRTALEIDPSDVGADMALLAESAFLIALVDDIQRGNPNDNVMEEVFFVLLWLILWLGCLMVIADKIFFSQLRAWIALAIGLVALTGASMFLSELGDKERARQRTGKPQADN